MVVTLDVSRLSGWLNAHADCRVDREGMRRGRHAGWEAGRRWVAVTYAACKRGPNWGSGAGHGSERTQNISLMSVTPAVFQADMSALKAFKFLKSWAMLVMAVTSQLAMGPYVSMAEAALAS